MSSKKVLSKLEQDLSEYLVAEICQLDPSKRVSGDTYKYRGLNLFINPNDKKSEKTIFVRIGVLEAEFKLGTCEKCSGGLSPTEERLISKWMSSADNGVKLLSVFERVTNSQRPAIIPFDLEYFYS